MRKHWRATLMGIGVTTIALPCLANIAAMPHAPQVGGLGALRSTSLDVLHERLTIDCTQAKQTLSCTFEARYAIRNPGREPEQVHGAFYSDGTQAQSITFNGLDISAAPEHVDGSKEERASRLFDGTVAQASFFLTVPAQGQGELVAKGLVYPADTLAHRGYDVPASFARHLLIGQEHHDGQNWSIAYLMEPLRTWGGKPTVDVEVRFPDKYDLQGGEWEVGQLEAGRKRARRSFGGGDFPRTLFIDMKGGAPLLIPGGMLVGAGWSSGEQGGFRIRAGLEVAKPDWILYSAQYEHVDGRHFAVPTIKAASPALLVIPSFGIGAGMPVQVHPDKRAGIRVEGDMHLYPLGFTFGYDYYPKAGESKPSYGQFTMMVQVGL